MTTTTRALCRHADAIPVESVVTGDTLAYLCPTCSAQLPASFGAELEELRARMARQDACDHTREITDITVWGAGVVASLCQDCGKNLTPCTAGGSDR
jgi:hypothetical protein